MAKSRSIIVDLEMRSGAFKRELRSVKADMAAVNAQIDSGQRSLKAYYQTMERRSSRSVSQQAERDAEASMIRRMRREADDYNRRERIEAKLFGLVNARAGAEERAAIARRSQSSIPAELQIRTARLPAGATGGRSSNPITQISEQAERFNKVFRFAGGALIADMAGRSLSRIPEAANKYRDSLRKGYTRTEAAADAMADMLPGVGTLARGMRSFAEWLRTSRAVLDGRMRAEEEKQRKEELDRAKGERAVATREVVDGINRGRRSRALDRQEGFGGQTGIDARYQRAVDEARAEFDAINSRRDIGSDAKDAAKADRDSKIAAAYQRKLDEENQANRDYILEMAAERQRQEDEIAEMRKRADDDAYGRLNGEGQLRLKQIQDEAAARIAAASAERDALNQKYGGDARRVGLDPDGAYVRKVEQIEAERDRRMSEQIDANAKQADQERKNRAADSNALREQTMSPAERIAREAAKLDELMRRTDGTGIDAETAGRRMAQLLDTLPKAAQYQAPTAVERRNAFATSITPKIEDTAAKQLSVAAKTDQKLARMLALAEKQKSAVVVNMPS